jgi:hypothetical protein
MKGGIMINIEKIKQESESKLKVGMLGWQLATTVNFSFFFILFTHFNCISEIKQLIIFWGLYVLFTIYHIMFYIFWRFIVIKED